MSIYRIKDTKSFNFSRPLFIHKSFTNLSVFPFLLQLTMNFLELSVNTQRSKETSVTCNMQAVSTLQNFAFFCFRHSSKSLLLEQKLPETCNSVIVAAAASEPEANERGSSLISRRLHYRGLQSLFLTKRKELWLCANGRFRMRTAMRKELWLCANGNILGCAVIWRKELWPMDNLGCVVNHVLSCHGFRFLLIFFRSLVSKRL